MKRPVAHIVILLLVIAMFPVRPILMAQQSNTFYLMHSVPQSNLLNPAVQLRCKYFIGIPVINSIHVSYSNTAFTYNDLAGSDTWNIEGVTDQMHRVDLYSAETMLHPVSLGYRHKSYYFTFHIGEMIHGYPTVPNDLTEMMVYGNGPVVGETARFNGLRAGAYHTREYSLGVSKVLGPYLTAGIHAKLLFGKANLHTSRSRVGLTTREDNFGILMDADYTLNSSFPITLTEDADGNINGVILEEIDPYQYMMNRGNRGFALDLGVIYRYDEKITLSASILDLGFVRWKTDLNNVHGEGLFEYNGTDINTLLFSTTFLSEMSDSLLNALEVTNTQDAYTAFLPTQVFLGGSYQYSDKISFGLVNRNVIFQSKLHSSFTVSAQADLAERFLATVSWSYLNNSLKNVGIGIAYHARGIQFHAVTDNLIGFLYPFNTRTVNIRTGFNLMLGCPRNKSEERREESYGNLPRGGDCPYPEKPGKERKKREKAVRRLNRM